MEITKESENRIASEPSMSTWNRDHFRVKLPSSWWRWLILCYHCLLSWWRSFVTFVRSLKFSHTIKWHNIVLHIYYPRTKLIKNHANIIGANYEDAHAKAVLPVGYIHGGSV
jgi:hypothetical protein